MSHDIVLHIATARDWDRIEAAIHDVLPDNPTPAMVSTITRRMREFYAKVDEHMTTSVAIPSSPDAEAIAAAVQSSLRNLENGVQEFTSKILFDRLLLEMQMYRLERGR